MERARGGAGGKKQHQVNFQQRQTTIHRHLPSTAAKSACLYRKLLKAGSAEQSPTWAHVVQWNIALAYDANQCGATLCKAAHKCADAHMGGAGCDDNSRDGTHACSIEAARLARGHAPCRYLVYDIDVRWPCVSISASVPSSSTLLAPESGRVISPCRPAQPTFLTSSAQHKHDNSIHNMQGR